MTIFYFSSTGNCLYLCKRLGGTLISIPRALKEDRLQFNDEVIGIVCPCYYFGIPKPVERFLRRADLQYQYAFGILSYGNFSGGAVHGFWKTAGRHGIRLSYVTEILMVDNYVPLFDIEEQVKLIPEKNIEESLDIIISDISHRTKYRKPPGILDRLLTPPARLVYRLRLRNADSRFSIEDGCNNCGVCEMICPVDISSVTVGPVFDHRCEECLGCTLNCPQNAIRVRGEKSRRRFLNENIRTPELFL